MLVTLWDQAGAGDVGHTVGPGSCGGCWSHRGTGQLLGMSVTPWDRAAAGDVGPISFPQQGDALWLPLCSVTLSALLYLFSLIFEMEM